MRDFGLTMRTLKTREFWAFILFTVIVVMAGVYWIETYGIPASWAFVMGIAATVFLSVISDRLSDRAVEKVEAA